jgi:hypothetical protein
MTCSTSTSDLNASRRRERNGEAMTVTERRLAAGKTNCFDWRDFQQARV